MRLENAKHILIYRDHLLAPSETFIKSQAKGLKSFQPYFVGSRLIKGLEIGAGNRIVINQGGAWGRIKEIGFKLTGYSWGITKQLRSMKPQLMHAHFGPDGALALPISEELNIPLIVTFHGYDATTKDEYAKKSYYTHRNYLKKRQVLQRKGQLFIAVSDFIRGKLIQQGYPQEKVIRHYIGVDTDAFKPDPAIVRQPTVLFVGRLVEVKGCEYVIRAMQIIQEANPEIELVIIGDGPLRGELEKLAAQSLTNYRFLGVQPQAVVKEWMNRAKVFCVPSITAKSGAEEAFGIVFVEASAMGLPVVSFANGGIPEAVRHRHTGFLAKEKDWRGLAGYIFNLLNDEQLWRRFSMNGQIRTREMFNLGKQTEQLEGIYKSLLQEQESKQPVINPEAEAMAVPLPINSMQYMSVDQPQI
jgi:colanic acid/amylovoran biosynthesis glycosyltransferase